MTQVLVTRPLESSRQLAGQLDALGLAAIVMPLYSFAACEPTVELKSAWSSPGKRILAVFTSPRAVRFGLPHLPHDAVDDLEIAAVGAATRTKLESHGHPVHLQANTGYTSEDLLQMPELAADPGEAVIFCAPGGREALSNGLQALGWGVINAMVYERIPLLPAQAQVDAIMAADDLLTTWTSVSALELARENMPAEAWDKILKAPALVISDRIAHHLQNLGASRVIRADGPGNSDLLQSIQRLTGRLSSA
jgi:uroporphyrinogen-III synthase